MPLKLKLDGSIRIEKPVATVAFPSLSSTLILADSQTRAVVRPNSGSINSPSSYVDMLATLGITKVTFLYLRVSGGSLLLKTSSVLGGANQLIPVSNFVALSFATGAELTAVAVQGTADYEIIVAGDP